MGLCKWRHEDADYPNIPGTMVLYERLQISDRRPVSFLLFVEQFTKI